MKAELKIHYRERLEDGSYSAPATITQPITEAQLAFTLAREDSSHEMVVTYIELIVEKDSD